MVGTLECHFSRLARSSGFKLLINRDEKHSCTPPDPRAAEEILPSHRPAELGIDGLRRGEHLRVAPRPQTRGRSSHSCAPTRACTTGDARATRDARKAHSPSGRPPTQSHASHPSRPSTPGHDSTCASYPSSSGSSSSGSRSSGSSSSGSGSSGSAASACPEPDALQPHFDGGRLEPGFQSYPDQLDELEWGPELEPHPEGGFALEQHRKQRHLFAPLERSRADYRDTAGHGCGPRADGPDCA